MPRMGPCAATALNLIVYCAPLQLAQELSQVSIWSNNAVRVLSGAHRGQQGTVFAIHDGSPLVKIGNDIKPMEMQDLGRLVRAA